MSNDGAAPRAAAATSNARAEASRQNGARSRGPRTAEGKARSAMNALKHGMRAQRYVVLPDESAVEFAALQTALFEELAPAGALQLVLARRIAIAAWRLARADRLETEVFAERRWDGAGVGIALIRDGNGTRSFETVMRYRSAAMAEFMRALRTLKALQAEQAVGQDAGAELLELPPARTRPPAAGASCRAPDEPEPAGARPNGARHLAPNEPEPVMEYVLPEPPAGRARHEPAAPAPAPAANEPERRPATPAKRSLAYVLPATPAPGHTLHEPPVPWTPGEAALARGGEPEADGAARGSPPK